MRDMQTEILKGLETSDADTNTRITALEKRVLLLELRPRPK